MYESFFGLTGSPFSMTPDPGALFLTASHREALAGLHYAITRRKGFVVLVGEAGTGKTTLLRKLQETLPETAQISMVLNPTLTPAEFLELLLLNFGLDKVPESKAQRLRLLDNLLREADRADSVPVLIVDEAHKLNFEVLEEIRLLTNFETNEKKLLQIVLSGQPELQGVLNRPELWQLKQRVAVRLRINPLTRSQVADYIGHRWLRVGGGVLPFGEQVISMIAELSKGIPRLINSLCDNALLLAFSDSSRIVGSELITEVVGDLGLDLAPRLQAEPVGNGKPAMSAKEAFLPPLTLGVLERYSSQQRAGLFGLRWNRRPRTSLQINGKST